MGKSLKLLRSNVRLLAWTLGSAIVGFFLATTFPFYINTYAAPATRVFNGDAGLILNFVKPDKTADFEATVAKLNDALKTSTKPERQAQAKSWKIFRAAEPGADGSVLYVFMIDPAVKDADYTVSSILAEAFPDQVGELYKQFAGAYASGQNFVNLTLVAALGN
jgi:hypothetical protein